MVQLCFREAQRLPAAARTAAFTRIPNDAEQHAPDRDTVKQPKAAILQAARNATGAVQQPARYACDNQE